MWTKFKPTCTGVSRPKLFPKIISALLFGLVATGCDSEGAPEEAENLTIPAVSFNVKFGELGLPQQFSETLAAYDPQLVFLSEVPGEGWSGELANSLGLEHWVRSQISSAHHDDKYKSILSLHPIESACEIEFNHEGSWSPASAIRAVMIVGELQIALYSLHIAYSDENDAHISQLADVLRREPISNVIVAGDFNHRLGDEGMKALMQMGYSAAWNAEQAAKLSSVPAWETDGLIDHILVRGPALELSAGQVLETTPLLSDHHPVLATVELLPSDASPELVQVFGGCDPLE